MKTARAGPGNASRPGQRQVTSDEEGTLVYNAADELEMIAVSKLPFQPGAICAGSNTFEEDMVCQAD